jgi:hypothetical protein
LGVHLNEKNHNAGCSTLDINIDQSGLNAGFSYYGLHPAGDIVQAVVGGGGYLDGLLHMPDLII